MYQGSMCIGGTTRSCMGVAVGCGMCVAVCRRVSIAMGIGKHQTLAKIFSRGSINDQAQFRVQRTSDPHSSLGQQASQVHTMSRRKEKGGQETTLRNKEQLYVKCSKFKEFDNMELTCV